MAFTVTTEWSNAESVTPTDINTNFDDIETKIDSMDGEIGNRVEVLASGLFSSAAAGAVVDSVAISSSDFSSGDCYIVHYQQSTASSSTMKIQIDDGSDVDIVTYTNQAWAAGVINIKDDSAIYLDVDNGGNGGGRVTTADLGVDHTFKLYLDGSSGTISAQWCVLKVSAL